MRAVHKPWGSMDLLPWSKIQDDGTAIGELWCQRSAVSALEPSLLLKLLFTSEPLSIQVHPDDTYARSIGLDHGKTEAWYILSATDDAKVALGLNRKLDSSQLRASIKDGSIADMVKWWSVQKDDVILVPAGTIHAIGPGIVLAEIQQRSDATFRLFDYGRHRKLDVEDSVAASNRDASITQPIAESLSDARTLLIATTYFVLERFDLVPNSSWDLKAEQESWLLVLSGQAELDRMNASVGKAFFLDADKARIEVGWEGLSALLAYPGPRPAGELLTQLAHSLHASSTNLSRPSIASLPALLNVEVSK
jgi:mannose-6-phosphate isomerase